ncbi:MAG: universal stress protein A [Myxococcota bacterium]|jgi:universal stress protein A
MNINTILVPIDFSEDSNKALSTAKELAKTFGAKVVVLHAYNINIALASPMGGGYAVPVGFFEEIREHAITAVERAAKELADDGIEAIGVAHGEPAAVSIVAEAKSLPADLIVMGTRGLTGLKHVMLGSIAERIVRTAPCPVLTVKADS